MTDAEWVEIERLILKAGGRIDQPEAIRQKLEGAAAISALWPKAAAEVSDGEAELVRAGKQAERLLESLDRLEIGGPMSGPLLSEMFDLAPDFDNEGTPAPLPSPAAYAKLSEMRSALARLAKIAEHRATNPRPRIGSKAHRADWFLMVVRALHSEAGLDPRSTPPEKLNKIVRTAFAALPNEVRCGISGEALAEQKAVQYGVKAAIAELESFGHFSAIDQEAAIMKADKI